MLYKVKHMVKYHMSKEVGTNASSYSVLTTQTKLQDVDELKQELLSKLRTLGERYEWTHNGRPSVIMVAKTVSSYACERQIKHLLENGNLAKENQKFDSYYRQKSEFATLKILECLKRKLTAEHVDAEVLTEVPSDVGRYDVVVIQGYPCKVFSSGEEIVRIEVKASLGLNFEQIDRYLWDSSPLILARIVTGHVAKLEPPTLQAYINFSLKELNAKVDRLTADNIYTIPGTACMSCIDHSCPNNRGDCKKRVSVVTMPDSEFGDDITSFFQNLSYVAEKTASMVIEELKTPIPCLEP